MREKSLQVCKAGTLRILMVGPSAIQWKCWWHSRTRQLIFIVKQGKNLGWGVAWRKWRKWRWSGRRRREEVALVARTHTDRKWRGRCWRRRCWRSVVLIAVQHCSSCTELLSLYLSSLPFGRGIQFLVFVLWRRHVFGKGLTSREFLCVNLRYNLTVIGQHV